MKWTKKSLREALEHYKTREFLAEGDLLEIPECPTSEEITDYFVFTDGTAIAVTEGRTEDNSTYDNGEVVTPMSETIASEVWIYG